MDQRRESFGEEVARGAQFIEAFEPPDRAFEEITDQWYKITRDVNRFARENPGAALGAGIAAGVLIGVVLGRG